MADKDLWLPVLRAYYNRRREGLVRLSAAEAGTDVTQEQLPHISQQLSELGYIEWEPFEDRGTLIDGMGRINVYGIAEIEGSDGVAGGRTELGVSARADSSERLAIFVSHSSRDEDHAQRLVDLLLAALPLEPEQIRCTSLAGHRLPGGTDTASQLRREAVEARAFLGLVSAEGLRSTYVLFEFGARWGTTQHFVPILVPGASTLILKGPLTGVHVLRADQPSDMHQLVSELAGQLDLAARSPQGFQRFIDALHCSRTADESARDATAHGAHANREVPVGELRSASEALELYDRRIVLYRAAITLVKAALANANVTHEEIRQFSEATGDAPFLLGDAIEIRFDELRKQAWKLRTLNKLLDDPALPVGDKRDRIAEQEHELLLWFSAQPPQLMRAFRPFLDLSGKV